MQLLNSVKFTVLCILSAITFYPVLVVLLLPILVYRKLVEFLVQKWDPNVRQIISGIDNVFVGENPYAKPLAVIAPYMLIKAKVDRNKIVQILNRQIMDTGEYPELTQRIVQRFGYNFWYQPSNYIRAENYVKYLHPECPEKPVTSCEIRLLQHKGYWKRPFDPRQSPWEIILAPNYIDEEDPSIKSMIMIRVNHCLMDGMSLLNIFRKFSVSSGKLSENYMQVKERTTENVSKLFLLMATFPYFIMQKIFSTKENSDFMNKVVALQKTGLEVWKSKSIPSVCVPINVLKKVKNFHNVSMTSLFLAIVMEAAVRLIIKKTGGVPKENLYLQMPLPRFDHPDSMTNHLFLSILPNLWALFVVRSNLGKMRIKIVEKDPVMTLKRISNEFERLRHSITPSIYFATYFTAGLLPTFLTMDVVHLAAQSTIAYTNFAGPSEKTDVFGYEYSQMGFTGNIGDIKPAFVFTTFSCNGILKIDASTTGLLLKSEQDVIEFRKSIEDILSTFQNTSIHSH